MLAELKRRLRTLAHPERAAHSQRFFKTAPGQHGHGDKFLGLTVPTMRGVVREFRELPLADAEALLASPWHEDRLVALMILVEQYRRTPAPRNAIYALSRARTARTKTGPLVGVPGANSGGAPLGERSRKPLLRLAKSTSLWERRI